MSKEQIRRRDVKYRCRKCGRDKFDSPWTAHKCIGKNYHKRHLDFEAIIYPAPKGRLYSEHPDPTPECTCVTTFCPYCREIWLKKVLPSDKWHDKNLKDPAPPLNARVAKIPLTQDKFAFVDLSDYERVNKFRWCITRRSDKEYAHRRDGKRFIKMHRFILDAQDGEMVDHIDGDGLNNCRSNLRLCTNQQNQFNSRSQINSKSKYKGVSWHEREGKWSADIRIDKKLKCLGYFDDETEAAQKYDEIAQETQGEFARLNFPQKPLRARVARALGWTFITEHKGHWAGVEKHTDPTDQPIPPYDTDDALAIQALEEYTLNNNMRATIRFTNTASGRVFWRVNIYRTSKNEWAKAENNSLARAICEAIDKHSEGE
jgi:hypothetical protein